MVVVGGLLVGVSWVLNSYADSLTLLYVAAAIGGVGAGAVYGACVGNALKWFPDRRGLAAGLTAAGFGAGSALTVVPISDMIESERLPGDVPVVRHRAGRSCSCSWRSCCAPRRRRPGDLAGRGDGPADAPRLRPGEVLRTPVFWVMY